jgi:mRNA-degrading endonuclease RelE of RelBE toxin-antitoxin system
MTFDALPEFEKDLKRLLKKYRTLETDLNLVKQILTIRPDAQPPFSFRIEGLHRLSCVIKMKKITSDSFKGRGNNSGFRLIYAFFKEEKRITFIELYHKSEQELEDRDRILRNFV